MSYWMSDQQKNELLLCLHQRQKIGEVHLEDILRTRMELEAVDAQTKAAVA